jgi:hypothetical protein
VSVPALQTPRREIQRPPTKPLDSIFAGAPGLPSDCFVTIVTDNPLSVDDSTPGVLPSAYTLQQNYPNPFNAQTVIAFDLPRTTDIELTVINLLGEQVRTIAAGRLAAGTHHVVWDGTDAAGQLVASGMYFYRLQAGEVIQTKKMLLLK